MAPLSLGPLGCPWPLAPGAQETSWLLGAPVTSCWAPEVLGDPGVPEPLGTLALEALWLLGTSSWGLEGLGTCLVLGSLVIS